MTEPEEAIKMTAVALGGKDTLLLSKMSKGISVEMIILWYICDDRRKNPP